MALTDSRAHGEFRHAQATGSEEQQRHAELRQRAREAVQAARTTVAHSQDLAWLFGEGTKLTLTTRCAWCRRYRVRGHWLDSGRTLIPAGRTTHGICDECAEGLREVGLSA